MRRDNPTFKSWLWWAALIALLAGGGLGYLFSLDPSRHPNQAQLIWAISGAIAGVCVISATADWWFRR